MPPESLRTESAIARGRVRTIIAVRWVGVAFGLVQVLTYQTLPYPPGVREVALGIVASIAASNLVFEVVRRRVADGAEVQVLGLAILVLDVVTPS